MNSTDYQTFEQRYKAVCQRDQNAVGHFFYGVLSTGIFCRPGCASRQPLEENVRFFECADQAQAAGFRACKRCHPERVNALTDAQQKVAKVCQILQDVDGQMTLAQLADEVAWSPYHLQRSFKRIMGVSPKQFQRQIRLNKLHALQGRGQTLTESIYQAGFSTTSHYYSEVKKMGAIRVKQAAKEGEVVYFQVCKTDLGYCLMAASEKGVCAVSLGDDADVLLKELEAQCPNAKLVSSQDAEGDWQDWFAQVINTVNGRKSESEKLPLDIRGTAFQQQVWQLLTDIPRGQTRTYSDIADVLGKPNAVRAVATACAANKIAVLIPCHRVVRKGGLLAGYRWGLERKEALLKREAK